VEALAWVGRLLVRVGLTRVKEDLTQELGGRILARVGLTKVRVGLI
jgi:hypothetical protein